MAFCVRHIDPSFRDTEEMCMLMIRVWAYNLCYSQIKYFELFMLIIAMLHLPMLFSFGWSTTKPYTARPNQIILFAVNICLWHSILKCVRTQLIVA